MPWKSCGADGNRTHDPLPAKSKGTVHRRPPCRGAVFTDGGSTEVARDTWMGNVHTIELDGGNAVVNAVGCRGGTITAE